MQLKAFTAWNALGWRAVREAGITKCHGAGKVLFSQSESFGFNSDIDLFAENIVCFDQYRRMLVKLIGGCVLLYCPAWPWLRMHAPVPLIKVREKGVGPG